MRRHRSRVRVLSATAVAVVAAAGTAIGAAAPAGAAARTPVNEGAPGWASPTAKVATVGADAPVTAQVILALPGAAAAEANAQAVSDPSSPSYQKFLTPAQAAAKFAPSASAVSAVESWLTSSGLSITSVPSNNLYVDVSGTAAAVEKAFDVGLSTYSVGGKRLRGADRALTAPTSVASLISGVTGVSDSLVKAKPQVVPPESGFRIAPPCSSYYGEKQATGLPQYPGLPQTLPFAPCGYVPSQIRSAYNTSAAVASGIDGRGVTVAVVGAYGSPYMLADAQEYAKKNDPAHPLAASQYREIVAAPTPGTEQDPTDDDPNGCGAEGWYGEEHIDVEAVHATAPGAKILYEGAADCLDPALDAAENDVVSKGLASVITNSNGITESEESPAGFAEFHEIALLAANEGITIAYSSGDDGDEFDSSGTVQTDYPASDPLVTAVGGTALGIGKQGQKLFETAWEDTYSDIEDGAWSPGSFSGGSGGGTSVNFAEPWYQKLAVPTALAKQNQAKGKTGRVVPDISMVGEPSTGILVGETQTFPDGVYYDQYRIGGTSISAPLFAGMAALSVQVHHHSLGLLNPAMYLLLSHSPAITDIKHVTGGAVRNDYDNGYDASDGVDTSLRVFDDDSSLAIKTTPGYDNTTGLGTPNGLLFLLGL